MSQNTLEDINSHNVIVLLTLNICMNYNKLNIMVNSDCSVFNGSGC